jgi:ethanolamine ammonia-lyase large subunit
VTFATGCSATQWTALPAAVAPGITPPNGGGGVQNHAQQDLILVAVPGGLAFQKHHWLPDVCRLQQPPTDDAAGIAASLLDGLLYGGGDAVIGINPATDSVRPR